MKVFFGSPGRISGLLLRIGQCSFAAASIGVMVSSHGFYSSTAFWYIILLGLLYSSFLHFGLSSHPFLLVCIVCVMFALLSGVWFLLLCLCSLSGTLCSVNCA